MTYDPKEHAKYVRRHLPSVQSGQRDGFLAAELRRAALEGALEMADYLDGEKERTTKAVGAIGAALEGAVAATLRVEAQRRFGEEENGA